MSYAEVNGQRIYFEDSGGDGPPVVLAHGYLMDHKMFAPQVAALAPAYRVITWDERGFGDTEYDDGVVVIRNTGSHGLFSDFDWAVGPGRA